jgi:adenosine deaminase
MENIPLYDLHLHLGGAIPVETVWHILHGEGRFSITQEELRNSMTYANDSGPYWFDKFLRKFDILNGIHWNENNINQTIEDVVHATAKQKVVYTEIRFSINKYLQYLRMDPNELTVFICDSLRAAGKKYRVSVAPILSIKYESSRDSQSSIMNLIDDAAVCDALVGIDLVGDETFFDARFYAPFFKQWKAAGKGVIAHVAESQSGENLRAAIELMKIDRVSHGIMAASQPDIMKFANDHNVAFDVALTSNIKTGVIRDMTTHPIKTLLENGCQVSLGTDDPVILDTTLEQEYNIALMEVGLTLDQIAQMKQNAIDRAFANR